MFSSTNTAGRRELETSNHADKSQDDLPNGRKLREYQIQNSDILQRMREYQLQKFRNNTKNAMTREIYEPLPPKLLNPKLSCSAALSINFLPTWTQKKKGFVNNGRSTK